MDPRIIFFVEGRHGGPARAGRQALRWRHRAMPRHPSPFTRLAVSPFFLLAIAACSGAPAPPPKPPVRELPPPALSLLTRAPLAYGDPTPITLPDDQGSA